MKKIYSLLLAVLVTATCWSKTTTWTGGVNSNWDNAANWDNGVPATGDIVIFPTNITATITRVAFAGNVNLASLSILGNSSIRLVNSSARILTITNGVAGGNELIIEEDAQLTLGSNIDLTLGNGSGANTTGADISGVLVIETNRTFDSDNTNVLTTVSGTIQNSGTVTGTASRLSFAAGGEYIHARNGGLVPFATWNAASTATIQGIINTGPGNFNQAFGNFTWNNPSQALHFNLNGALTTVNGDMTIVSTGAAGSLRFKNIGAAGATVIAGDYVQSGGSVYIVGSSNTTHTLSVRGDFRLTGGTVTRSGTGGAANVTFSGTTVQVLEKDPAATISSEINFTIANNAKVDFGTSELNGSTGVFVLSAGGKIITANSEGLGPAGSIQMTRTLSSSADYEFQGARTGVFTTTVPNTVRDLVVNNSVNGGDVLLDQPLTVTRTLMLTEGLITTTSNLLTVGTSGSATAPTLTSFVNGPLAKVGTTAFTFPVGKAGEGYRTIGITAPSGNATFRAEFIRSNPGGGALAPTLSQISACEFWDLERTGGGAGVTARVVLSWEPLSSCGSSPAYVTNPATLRVAHFNGTTWMDEGNSATTGNNTSGTVTSANLVSAFSPFALGSSTSLDNPLPVVFANVRAYEKNNGVQIEWSNLTEKDVAGYVIERSANGTDFAAIGQQAPTSNQDDRADYSAFDASPLSGTNYYRVKAEETTGKIVYSKVLSVSLGLTTQSLRLYPNPVKGSQVNISLSNIRGGQYDLRVVNMAGQDIVKQRINSQGSTITETIDLPAAVAPGVYHMIITGADYREVKKFIVQ